MYILPYPSFVAAMNFSKTRWQINSKNICLAKAIATFKNIINRKYSKLDFNLSPIYYLAGSISISFMGIEKDK